MSAIVELRRIDGEKQELIKFKIGKHVLGRGPSLKCTEKKISRNHAILEVSEDVQVAVTPIHVNPLFYQEVGCDYDDDDGFLVLKKDEAKYLKNGDKISLLPSSWTYAITITENCENNDVVNVPEADKVSNDSNSNNNNNSRKRILPDWLQNLDTGETSYNSEPSSKSKKRNTSRKKIANNGQNAVTVKNSKEKIETEKQKISNVSETTQSEKGGQKNDKTDEASQSEKEKDEKKLNKEKNENTQSSNSSKNSQSQKRYCPYGSKCYRKNPQHFEEFSHSDKEEDDKVDSDKEDGKVDSDEDDRPECEHGLDCYRKNPQHLKDFKHVKRKRNAAKKAKAATRRLNDDADDDDTNDSFIVDDDDVVDPEYAASDSETDDDYYDLMQDANSFIKGIKK